MVEINPLFYGLDIMQTGILFIARIFPLPDQGQKNITQL